MLAATLALAILAASPAVTSASSAVPGPVMPAWQFLAAFAAATALLIMLSRSRRGARVFSLLFTLAVFVGIGVLAERFFGTAASVVVVSAAICAHYGFQRVAVYDLVLLPGMAGLAFTLGDSLQPIALAVILSILSIYDLLAVYATGHMTRIAAGLLRQKALFAIIIPVTPAGFRRRLKDVEPGGEFVIMGTGDIVLPAMLAASVARYGTAMALLPALGALIGLAAVHALFFSQPERRPMPALPPIALGAVAGFMLTLAIF